MSRCAGLLKISGPRWYATWHGLVSRSSVGRTQNPQSTPPDQPIVMPVHPSHIPLAPMYPPDFDSPTSVIDTPTP
eukprot:scaffold1966_cov118-Isochrysis_galbana.AAC.6